MRDAAVVAGLMGADTALLLEHRQLDAGLDLRQSPRDGEPDDPGTDDPNSLSHHADLTATVLTRV